MLEFIQEFSLVVGRQQVIEHLRGAALASLPRHSCRQMWLQNKQQLRQTNVKPRANSTGVSKTHIGVHGHY